ncbi:MAG: hypothetical protein ACXW4S_01800 [Candidatus Deferrimicrobiaceae bacterium]
MRDINNFSASEWLRFLPFKYAFKQTRNDAWLAIYKKFRPKALDMFLRESERLRNRNVALVVAFEQPWVLDWLLRMAQRNLTDTAVLVFDNSRRTVARRDIELVCRNHGIPYLALPANPTRHVNRSHGMSMTWIFHNVVRAIKPRMFAFIDHDMIPVRKAEFSERLADQPFFGKLRTSPWAWQLWAGYCLFDFSTVADLPINFLYDFSQKLDTGARNWGCLYQHYDRDRLRFASSRYVEIRDPATGESTSVEMVDDRWLHIGNIGYNDNFRSKAQFCENLAHALDQGISWPQLCADGNADEIP